MQTYKTSSTIFFRGKSSLLPHCTLEHERIIGNSEINIVKGTYVKSSSFESCVLSLPNFVNVATFNMQPFSVQLGSLIITKTTTNLGSQITNIFVTLIFMLQKTTLTLDIFR